MRELILEALDNVSDIPVNDDTILFGPGGILDSLDLVEFILELECLIQDKTNSNVVITTDKAFSYKRNPFGTIKILDEFLSEMVYGTKSCSDNGN